MWEWIEQGIQVKQQDGNNFYAFGGDFLEEPNDGGFCIDGLVSPDRKPSSGLMELKQVYLPFKVDFSDISNGTITIWNLYDFLENNGCVASLRLERDGEFLKYDEIDISGLGPKEKKVFSLKDAFLKEDLSLKEDLFSKTGQYYLLVRFFRIRPDGSRAELGFIQSEELRMMHGFCIEGT